MECQILRFTPQGLFGEAELYQEHVRLRREMLWDREGLSAEDSKRQYLDLLDRRAVHFLAFEGPGEGQRLLIGMAQFDPVTARLRQVLVRPEHTRKGVGRALVERVAKEAQEAGCAFLQVNAWHGSVGFYSSLGFLPHGQPQLDASNALIQILIRALIITSAQIPSHSSPSSPSPTTIAAAHLASGSDSSVLLSRGFPSALHPPLRNEVGPKRTRVILVRHGESLNNALLAEALNSENPESALQSWQARRFDDPPLSPLGLRQALACGDALEYHLKGSSALVWVSPLLRTLQTATAIDAQLRRSSGDRVQYSVHGRCYEFGGCYQGQVATAGRSPAEIQTQFPLIELFLPPAWAQSQRGWYEYTGSTARESRAEFVERVTQLVADIWRFSLEHGGARSLIVVGHGDLFDLL
ncbi:MAG: GNAT family N-acetyltransferase, partial [archaeon]|nr:GNAT family N-acetyltransferase [archaeon]